MVRKHNCMPLKHPLEYQHNLLSFGINTGHPHNVFNITRLALFPSQFKTVFDATITLVINFFFALHNAKLFSVQELLEQ